MFGTVQPGIFTADGTLIPVRGGPWIIGKPPVIRVGYVGPLYTVRATSRWTGTSWTRVTP